jgi:hypothetical protein
MRLKAEVGKVGKTGMRFVASSHQMVSRRQPTIRNSNHFNSDEMWGRTKILSLVAFYFF